MKKLIIILIAILIVLSCLFYGVDRYNYNNEISETEIKISIPIWNDDEKDTIIESFQIDIFKYYSLKKMHIYWSDCTTCGSQNYSFYKKPAKSTLSESDTINHGWYELNDKERGTDSVVFSINFNREMDLSELNEVSKQSLEDLGDNHIKKMKSENPKIQILKNKVDKFGGHKFVILEYQHNEIKHYLASFYLKDNNLVWLMLQDYTNSEKIKTDFYKMLNSIDE